MKEVFRHSDAGLVSVHQSLLENAGITTFVRNADTQQALVLGILTSLFPLPDFWPTLCVVFDDEYPAAMELLRDVKGAESRTPREWTCPQCGETVPGHFSDCWNCGHRENC